jgi:hypothetical protein
MRQENTVGVDSIERPSKLRMISSLLAVATLLLVALSFRSYNNVLPVAGINIRIRPRSERTRLVFATGF